MLFCSNNQLNNLIYLNHIILFLIKTLKIKIKSKMKKLTEKQYLKLNQFRIKIKKM